MSTKSGDNLSRHSIVTSRKSSAIGNDGESSANVAASCCRPGWHRATSVLSGSGVEKSSTINDASACDCPMRLRRTVESSIAVPRVDSVIVARTTPPCSSINFRSGGENTTIEDGQLRPSIKPEVLTSSAYVSSRQRHRKRNSAALLASSYDVINDRSDRKLAGSATTIDADEKTLTRFQRQDAVDKPRHIEQVAALYKLTCQTLAPVD